MDSLIDKYTKFESDVKQEVLRLIEKGVYPYRARLQAVINIIKERETKNADKSGG